MYTHVSKRINRREMIYLARCPLAKGLPTPRNVAAQKWTANCAPKSNLNCFQNCIQGRIEARRVAALPSLMGIYWLYPLCDSVEGLPCSSRVRVLAVAFLGCFFFFFGCYCVNFALHFLCFFTQISHCIFMVTLPFKTFMTARFLCLEFL